MKTRILLVEDHTIVRQGLRALIQGEADMEVIGEAADGRAAVELAEALGPDVVVMDLAMRELNGVDATHRIRSRCPHVQVLVLSMHDGEEYVRPALRAGANGYLLKGSGLSDLIAAIRKVARGEVVIDPALTHILVRDVQRGAASSNDQQARELTPRQREILQLVAEGHSSPSAAQLLGLSVKTVEGHRARIMERLGIHDLAGLVRYAIRIGLVSPEG